VGLREIVLRCLHKDPAKRPPTAAHVREALGLLRTGQSAGHIEQALGGRPERARGLVGAALAVLAVVATLAVYGISKDRGGPDEPRVQGVEARRAFEQAQTYEARGGTPADFTLAEKMYRKALALDAGNPFLRAHLARFLASFEVAYPGEQAGRIDEIRKLTADVLASWPDTAAAWHAQAWLHLIERDAEGAVESARKAIAADPADHYGYMLLGSALVEQGQVERGLDQLRKAIDIGEGHLWARARLAKELYDLGRMDEAATEYRRVLEYRPDSPAALNNLGVIYLGRGNYVEAITMLKRRLEVQPDDYAASNLGMAYFLLGRMDEAIAAFRQAVDLAPDQPTLKQNLAEAYEAAGQAEPARHWYGQAIADYDDGLTRMGQAARAASLAERAFCAAKLARFPEALQNIGEAVGLEPQNMNVLRSAARVHAMAGDRAQAYDFIRRAVTAGYHGEEIRNDPVFQAYHGDPEFLRLLTEPRT
jgi:tetratricopeptide (TPR) repeat protein